MTIWLTRKDESLQIFDTRALPQMLLTSMLFLAAMLAGPVWAGATTQAIQPPTETREPVDLERELSARWQAGGEIVLFAAADGTPKVGRRATPPGDAAEEQARRDEHFALARKLNLVLPFTHKYSYPEELGASSNP